MQAIQYRMSSGVLSRYLQRASTANTESTRCRCESFAKLATNSTTPESRYATFKTERFTQHTQHTQLSPGLKRYQTNELPVDRSEIRGVDSVVHSLIQTKFGPKKYAPVLRNPFVTVSFFPKEHFVSKYRKSNVAFATSSFSVSMMNSVKLEKEWKCYTGKYQNSGYLRTKANPMERAYKRTVTSKLFRGLFIKALDESRSLPHIDRIAGVFRCSISRIPIDDAERNSIQRDFARMINKITSDGKLWQSLSERASESNENKSLVSIARGIKERSVVDGLAQSQLRLPFIHDAVYKNSVHDNKISKRSHQNGRELHRLFGAKLQSKNPKQQQTQFRRKTTQQKGEKANWV